MSRDRDERVAHPTMRQRDVLQVLKFEGPKLRSQLSAGARTIEALLHLAWIESTHTSEPAQQRLKITEAGSEAFEAPLPIHNGVSLARREKQLSRSAARQVCP